VITNAQKGEENERENDEQCVYQPVGRITPLSARTLVLKALNTFDSFSHALIVLSPFDASEPPHEVPSASIEENIDTQLKGCLYIVKEVLVYFMRQGRGSLSFVSLTDPGLENNVIDSMIHGGFISLADSIFSFYRNESVDMFGFESDSTKYEEFSEYIWKILENPGKQNFRRWNRFADRSGLFQSISLSNIKR